MNYKVEVVGINSWTVSSGDGGYVFSTGVHVTEPDPVIKTAANNTLKYTDRHGKQSGVHVTETSDPVTDTVRKLHPILKMDAQPATTESPGNTGSNATSRRTAA
jgi:hypothetical protein